MLLRRAFIPSLGVLGVCRLPRCGRRRSWWSLRCGRKPNGDTSVRNVTCFVQVFARVVGAGYAVGVIGAHSFFYEGAADNVGVRVLVGQEILYGLGVRGCGRGGCG